MEIITYLEQLRSLATDEDTLRRAFIVAGIPSSTYYRAKYGAELKSGTAMEVAKVLSFPSIGDPKHDQGNATT